MKSSASLEKGDKRTLVKPYEGQTNDRVMQLAPPCRASKQGANFTALCDRVYTKSDGRQACSIFLGRGYSWLEANEKCSMLGGHLPVILTTQENTDIYNIQVIVLNSPSPN